MRSAPKGSEMHPKRAKVYQEPGGTVDMFASAPCLHNKKLHMHAGRLVLASALAALSSVPADGQFRDVSAESGLVFELVAGSAEKPYILESMTGGVAFVDYDTDGWTDIYLVNGGTLHAPGEGTPAPYDRLYRNAGDGTFSDVTTAAGLGDPSWGMGVAVADVDNNGFDDIFITNYGPNHLFLNRGDGTYSNAATSELEGNEWSSSASFGDYDSDGDVDLYVTNYLEFDSHALPEASQLCRYRGIPVQCGPRGMTPTADRLYENLGGGRFRDATSESGIGSVPAAYGLGVVWTDFDNDGDQDIYVANDSTANYLFRNNGDGTFSEVALLTGIALSADGKEQAGMGVDFGDFDNDALIDLVVTNFSDDYNTLYRNGGGLFRDISAKAGLVEPTWPKLSWGVRFVDFDLDGALDIVIADGHVYPEVDRHDFGIRYRQPNSAFRNVGDGTFEKIELPDGSTGPQSSRGLAAGDYDNDGRIDLVIANLDAPPTLLRGIAATGNWLLFDLKGTTSNRSAIGARVTVVAGNLRQVREVRSGGSYQSSNDRRLHFGLGDNESVEIVTIRWPSGTEQTLTGVAANQVLRIEEPAR